MPYLPTAYFRLSEMNFSSIGNKSFSNKTYRIREIKAYINPGIRGIKISTVYMRKAIQTSLDTYK
jgi:hypothetical protein